MIFLRNILLLLVQRCTNTIAILMRSSFRFQFVFIKILEKNYAAHQPFSFIQIGANDGISHDHLYSFVKSRNSRGVAIEPLKDFFEKLKCNYQYNPHVVTVNEAVHKDKRKVILYRLDPSKTDLAPHWAQGIASLDPHHHKRSHIPSDYIIAEEVTANNLMNIIEEHYHCNKVNLIQIDAEGYDLEILKMIDFKKIKPQIIRSEYINLSKAERLAMRSILSAQKYYTFTLDADFISVDLFQVKL